MLVKYLRVCLLHPCSTCPVVLFDKPYLGIRVLEYLPQTAYGRRKGRLKVFEAKTEPWLQLFER
jgi:hypothetical protein